MGWYSFLLVTNICTFFTQSFIQLSTVIYLALSTVILFRYFMVMPAYFLFFILSLQFDWMVGHFSGKNSWPKDKAAIIYLTNQENGGYQTGFVWGSSPSLNPKCVNVQSPASVNVPGNHFPFIQRICSMYIHFTQHAVRTTLCMLRHIAYTTEYMYVCLCAFVKYLYSLPYPTWRHF